MASPSAVVAATANSSASLISSPTLSTLVPHLLSARRSLSCVEQVSHANTIVRSTRQAIEAQTALTARTLYIKNASRVQVGTLEKVTDFVTSIKNGIRQEWEDVIRRVDEARDRLGKTVEVLKNTRVEEKLITNVAKDEDEEDALAANAKGFLVDFVDETGMKVLLERIDESGEIVSDAKEEFDMTLKRLIQGTDRVKTMLWTGAKGFSTVQSSTAIDDSLGPMEMLQTMEFQAGEMARNLESLVKHFDLCVTAIKNTEGGGAAASKIAKELPGGMDLDIGKDEPSEDIGEEEMQEIRAVIEKDAAEVEDVVADIKACLEEVEAIAGEVTSYGDHLQQEFQSTVSAFHLLEEVGKELPAHITQSQLFAIKWEEEKLKIEEALLDLEGLSMFYINFREAYDNLLIEVGRRKDVEKRINKIRKEAMARIDSLIDEEIEERQAFKDQQGDFLPIDIWPGLTLPPPRYEIVKVDDSGESIPDISASVINRAIKRVSHKKSK